MFPADEANAYKARLEAEEGIVAGPSTGAAYWLAELVLHNHENSEAQVAVIAADGRM